MAFPISIAVIVGLAVVAQAVPWPRALRHRGRRSGRGRRVLFGRAGGVCFRHLEIENLLRLLLMFESVEITHQAVVLYHAFVSNVDNPTLKPTSTAKLIDSEKFQMILSLTGLL
jgi:hypothetical protein